MSVRRIAVANLPQVRREATYETKRSNSGRCTRWERVGVQSKFRPNNMAVTAKRLTKAGSFGRACKPL